MRLPITIGGIKATFYNWWVLVAGKDSAGNPQPLKVETDGTLNVKNAAGTAVIGAVKIDQTTPGTTDRVTAGGSTAFPVVTPTLSVAGQYATGDYIGASTAPQSFANAVRNSGGSGVLQSLVVTDKTTDAAVDLEIWLFSATFTAPTDNAAWAITDAHQLLCLGVVEIPSEKWYANSNGKVATVPNIGLPIKPAATSLFFALVARGTTPTWASGDLQLTLGILQD